MPSDTNDGLQPSVESFELKLPMVAILTFRASFGAIFIQQSDMLTHHSNKVIEKWHMMPSQVQRRRLWLVVDVDDGAMVASWCGGAKTTVRALAMYQMSLNGYDRRRTVLGIVLLIVASRNKGRKDSLK
jgi:hypothetical protein